MKERQTRVAFETAQVMIDNLSSEGRVVSALIYFRGFFHLMDEDYWTQGREVLVSHIPLEDVRVLAVSVLDRLEGYSLDDSVSSTQLGRHLIGDLLLYAKDFLPSREHRRRADRVRARFSDREVELIRSTGGTA